MHQKGESERNDVGLLRRAHSSYVIQSNLTSSLLVASQLQRNHLLKAKALLVLDINLSLEKKGPCSLKQFRIRLGSEMDALPGIVMAAKLAS